MNDTMLTNDLKENIKLISENTPTNFNFKIRELILKGDVKCNVLYIKRISEKEEIEKQIIYPLLFNIDCDIKTLKAKIPYLSQKYLPVSDTEISSDVNQLATALKNGKTLVLIEDENLAIICNTATSSLNDSFETKIEESIRGEKSTFVDFIEINIALIQEKFKNNNLKLEEYVFGEENNSRAVLIYMENIIDPKVLSRLKSRLGTIDMPYIPGTGYLSQFIEKSQFGLFPQSKTTEKPDTVISDILQGKAAILINGCAYAIILPVVFVEFFQAFEDYSNKILLGNFDRLLRILSLFIILTISPIYLVLLEYNADLVPINLIKIIIISRKDIPLPPFLEILTMEVIIEFLREGGLRLPSIVGQTLGIVGGIILGQAAIQAGMVSPTTLIVVTITVIATFVIPNYEMSLSIRVLRFYTLIMALILGFFGIIIALFSIVAYLMNLDSLGIPYFSPFAPMRYKDLKDSVIRGRLKKIERRPKTFNER